MNLLCFLLSCVCYAVVRVCLYVPCGHVLGKGLPLGSLLWCLTVSLSLSHWYPGSGVVLDLSIPDLCTFTYFIERRNLYNKLYNVILRDRSFQKYTTCYFDASNCKRETALA